jgi:hypothetical protein
MTTPFRGDPELPHQVLPLSQHLGIQRTDRILRELNDRRSVPDDFKSGHSLEYGVADSPLAVHGDHVDV